MLLWLQSNVMKIIVSIFLVLSLFGCSSFGGAKGVPFSGLTEINSDLAQVYIYRPSRMAMGLAIPTTKIDGEKVEGVRNGSFIIYELPPGKHQFSLSNNGNWAAGNIDFEFEVEASKKYFFRLTARTGDMAVFGQFLYMSMGSNLHQVSKEFAVREMSELLFTRVWP